MSQLTIEMFAIRHIPSGNYLPCGNGFRGRGMTWRDPVVPNAIDLPRTFHTRNAARIALTFWLKGKHIGANENGYTYCDGVTHVKTRVASDMEIVPLHLEIP